MVYVGQWPVDDADCVDPFPPESIGHPSAVSRPGRSGGKCTANEEVYTTTKIYFSCATASSAGAETLKLRDESAYGCYVEFDYPTVHACGATPPPPPAPPAGDKYKCHEGECSKTGHRSRNGHPLYALPPLPARLPHPSARTNVLSGRGLLRLVCTTAPLSPRARSISGKCAVAAEGGVPKDTCESLCGGPPPPPPPRPTSFNCLVGPSGPTCEGAENGNYTSEPKCLSECHRTWLCKSGECEAVIDGSGVSHRPPTQPTHTCTRAHMHTYSYAIDLAPSFIHACLVLPLPPYLSPG